MNDDMLDLNSGMEVEKGGFTVHPEDYECPAQCTEVEFKKDPATGNVEAIIFKLDADGANVHEYFGLIAKGKRTIDMIKRQISEIIVSFGVRKVGEKSPRLIDDIKACQGQFCHLRLKLDKFQSNSTGKWLEGNKVKRWLSSEEYTRGQQKTATTTEMPQAAATKKSFDFG